MLTYRYHPGSTPLLISIPHAGTFIPDDIAAGLTDRALRRPDTDWHVDRLYDFAADLGAGLLTATHSRYVIDLNRPPDDRPLYAGADNTGLCPTTLFDHSPLYRLGQEPGAGEIERRMEAFWRPYHARLDEALRQTVDRHGYALLYDAHSIRSQVPRFFEGRLPDLNLGTADGASASPALEARLFNVCRAADGDNGYSSVLNGRFTGGYITRHYGHPANGIHAVQLELSQCTYMRETAPYRFDAARAARIRPVLRQILAAMLDWARGIAMPLVTPRDR